MRGLVLIDDKGEQAREVTVFDGGHEGMILAERAGKNHRDLRTCDDRRLFAAGTGDGFVLGGFAEGGVVGRG